MPKPGPKFELSMEHRLWTRRALECMIAELLEMRGITDVAAKNKRRRDSARYLGLLNKLEAFDYLKPSALPNK